MPCYDPRNDDDARDERERHRRTERRLDEMTARACRLSRMLEKLGHMVPQEDRAWWNEHKKFDRREGRF